MSISMFQSIILQMKDITERNIGVIDDNGVVVACTALDKIGVALCNMSDISIDLGKETTVCGDITLKPLLNWGSRMEFSVFVEGTDENAGKYCRLAAVALNSSKELYDEKYDKVTFVKNIILNNILPGDIYIKANEARFSSEASRVVFLVCQQNKADFAAVEMMQRMFSDRQQNYVISINEAEIALVKEVPQNISNDELYRIAEVIENRFNIELGIKVIISIGTVVNQLKDIATSYKEAQVAIEVGKIFEGEKTIINYENLGIGRLIYQLPTTLCDMFLSEVFKRNSIDSLDQETVTTINKFFENNLNVSETSRKLFVHRNTLVYRLEKIKKLTGLDLQKFDHAVIFKVALMVKKYMSTRGSQF